MKKSNTTIKEMTTTELDNYLNTQCEMLYIITRIDDVYQLPLMVADTLAEAAEFLGANRKAVENACRRGNVINKLYKVEKITL